MFQNAGEQIAEPIMKKEFLADLSLARLQCLDQV
jgi:hypothetical protein